MVISLINIGQIPENPLSLTEPFDIPIEIEPEANTGNDVLEISDNPLDDDRLGATDTMLLSNLPQSTVRGFNNSTR